MHQRKRRWIRYAPWHICFCFFSAGFFFFQNKWGDERKINIPLALHTYVAETREKAVEIAKPHLNLYLETRQYGRGAQFEDLEAREQLLIGTPDDVIRMLKKYEEVGCDRIMMLMNFGGLTHEKVVASMELVAREVVPAFRSKTGFLLP
jgi:alkanesulfonate monooxygenase SsuD/methylene tetrahydromethanopterin reductase-like flavin-dependent oxidoreductase (luciferase family)